MFGMDLSSSQAFVVSLLAVILAYRLAKTWLTYRYSPSEQLRTGPVALQQRRFQDLNLKAEQLEKRIDQLERILDKEAPGWEKRN